VQGNTYGDGGEIFSLDPTTRQLNVLFSWLDLESPRQGWGPTGNLLITPNGWY